MTENKMTNKFDSVNPRKGQEESNSFISSLGQSTMNVFQDILRDVENVTSLVAGGNPNQLSLAVRYCSSSVRHGYVRRFRHLEVWPLDVL